MFVWIIGIAWSRRRMEEKGREKNHLCKFGSQGRNPSLEECLRCFSRVQRAVSLFVLASFICLQQHSKWMYFVSSAARLSESPMALPRWATRDMSGVSQCSVCCRGQADGSTKLGKGLTEDSWPNWIADAQPAKSVEVCVILCRLRWYVLHQQCRKKDNQVGHGSLISIKLNIIKMLQYNTRGWKWLVLWLQKGHQYRMSFLGKIQENV